MKYYLFFRVEYFDLRDFYRDLSCKLYNNNLGNLDISTVSVSTVIYFDFNSYKSVEVSVNDSPKFQSHRYFRIRNVCTVIAIH